MVILNRTLLEARFKNLYSTNKINFSNENITSIHRDTFKGLTNLVKLNLDHNRISSVCTDIFRGLNNLKQIDLSHNFIKDLNEKQFYFLTSLTHIYLHNNHKYLMNNKKMVLYLEKSVIRFTFHSEKNSNSIDRIQNSYSMNYKMNHKNRIAALFLNDFEGSIPGHDQDIKNTKKLGLIVTVHENKTSQETIDLLNYYAEADYSDADCFLCVFSSHGNKAGLLASDHKLFDLISIIQEIFTGNKSLNGKPKLFFINACRGDKIMGTLENKIKLNAAKGSSNQSNTPEICDIMIYYSTVDKYLSFGDINGSTFIEAFVEVFNKYGKKEQLMDMVTRINQKIAALPPFQYIDPDTKSTHNAKQMPTIAECSLTKRVFLLNLYQYCYFKLNLYQ